MRNNVIPFKLKEKIEEQPTRQEYVCSCNSNKWHLERDALCCAECGNQLPVTMVYRHLLTDKETV